MKRFAAIFFILLGLAGAAHAFGLGLGNRFGKFGVTSGPVTAPYIGQLATRSRLTNNFAGAGGYSQMSKSIHITRSPVTSLAIDVPTWYIQHSTQREATTGGTWQVRVSVEYPPGTCTQLAYTAGSAPTFSGGSTSLSTVPDNSDNWFWASISIPVNTTVAVRIYLTAGAGLLNYGPAAVGASNVYQAGEDLLNGERYRFGNSGITDQTATCDAITDSNPTNGNTGFGPAAIVGPTTQPTFYLWGDSRVEGIYDFYNDNSTNIGALSRLVGPYFGYINGGIAALTTANWITGVGTAHQIALSKYTSHLMSEDGFNDSTGGGAASTIITNNQTAWGLFGANRVLITTLAPSTTSTDAYQTTVNQTALSYTSTITAYNTLVRAGVTGTIGFVDLANVATGSIGGTTWITSTITGTYTESCASNVMTVSAVASGVLAPLDSVTWSNGTSGFPVTIKTNGTGTGGTGTYNVLGNGACTSSGKASSSNPATIDGVHEGPHLNQLYNTSGAFNPATIHYP